MKRPAVPAAIGLIILLFAGTAATGEKATALDDLTKGKAALQKKCKFCHSLTRTLAQNKDRGGWSQTVKRMVTYGAPLNKAEREQVTDYLAAKSSFETNCNACHSNLRVLSDSAIGTDWSKTVERMSAHLDELAKKDAEKAALTPEEVEAIAAYLTLVIPKN